MHATFVTLWLQVVQPLANVHETKWTPHVKRETDVAQSYTSSGPRAGVQTSCLFQYKVLELVSKLVVNSYDIREKNRYHLSMLTVSLCPHQDGVIPVEMSAFAVDGVCYRRRAR